MDNQRTRYVDTEESQYEAIEQLVSVLDDALMICDNEDGTPNTRQMAEYLIAYGVSLGNGRRRDRKRRRR